MCIGIVCVFRIRITNKKLRGLVYPSESTGGCTLARSLPAFASLSGRSGELLNAPLGEAVNSSKALLFPPNKEENI